MVKQIMRAHGIINQQDKSKYSIHVFKNSLEWFLSRKEDLQNKLDTKKYNMPDPENLNSEISFLEAIKYLETKLSSFDQSCLKEIEAWSNQGFEDLFKLLEVTCPFVY